MGTANDVLKNALTNEVKAAAFYNMASKITSDDETRMLFIELAGLEDGHARDFLTKATGTELVDGFDPEAYLNELESGIDESTRIEHSDLIECGDMKTVLNFAISMEAHARDTYKVMATMVENPAIKKYCSVLSEEEEEHRKMLERALTSLDMDIDDRPGL